MVKRHLARITRSKEEQVSRLSAEELRDFDKILQITSFLLCKYEDKKAVYSLLSEFVSTIHASIDSLDRIDDKISEIVLSADCGVRGIKEIHARVSENLMARPSPEPPAAP